MSAERQAPAHLRNAQPELRRVSLDWRPWLATSAAAIGVAAVSSRNVGLIPVFLLIAYPIVGLGAIGGVRQTRDLFNPLSLLLALLAIRFSLPAVVLFTKNYSTPEYPIFSAMHLGYEDWLFGHVLALLGMLGLIVGWHLTGWRSVPVSVRPPTLPPGTWLIATISGLLGLLALALFVQGNVGDSGLAQTIEQGSFRGVVVQEGTGVFFLVSFLLIVGATVLTAHLISEGQSIAVSLIPVVLAAVVFFFLGGRARAATPLVTGLLMAWYASVGRGTLRPSLTRGLKWLTLILFVLVWLAAFGQLYRGAGGLSTIGDSITDMPQYLESGALVDFGHLHALAGASTIPPGELRGSTFVSSLLWPVSDLVGFKAENPGALLIRRTVGPQLRSWGLHTSLIGDSYLNFGAPAIVFVSALFGAGLKVVYRRFREGRMVAPLYALVFVYAVRIFVEGITKWSEALIIVVLTLSIFLVSKLLFRQSTRQNPPYPSPEVERGGLYTA